MTRDAELATLQHKIATLDQPGATELSVREREQLMAAVERLRADPAAAPRDESPWRRELDFFFVCLGYGLLAFTALVVLRWFGSAPPGGTGIFGLAFVAGLSTAALRRYYPQAEVRQTSWLPVAVAALALLVALIGLIATGAIGAIAGMMMGVVFFQALRRYRTAPADRAGGAQQQTA